jgi:hypothetical protein
MVDATAPPDVLTIGVMVDAAIPPNVFAVDAGVPDVRVDAMPPAKLTGVNVEAAAPPGSIAALPDGVDAAAPPDVLAVDVGTPDVRIAGEPAVGAGEPNAKVDAAAPPDVLTVDAIALVGGSTSDGALVGAVGQTESFAEEFPNGSRIWTASQSVVVPLTTIGPTTHVRV